MSALSVIIRKAPAVSLEERPQSAEREGLFVPRLLAAAHEQRGLVPEGAFHPGLQGEPFDREVTGGSPQTAFAHIRHIPSPTSYLGAITSDHNTIMID